MENQRRLKQQNQLSAHAQLPGGGLGRQRPLLRGGQEKPGTEVSHGPKVEEKCISEIVRIASIIVFHLE